MIRNLVCIVALLVVIIAGSAAAWEKLQPMDNYIKYSAVISYPIYGQSPYLRFISILEQDAELISRIDWRDSILCDSGNGFEEVDVYPSGMDNRKASKSPQSLIDLAEQKPTDKALYGDWRTAVIQEVLRLEKTSWKYQIQEMEWPSKNTLCYGKHKITIKTPYFGFDREVELDSSAFWLIGS